MITDRMKKAQVGSNPLRMGCKAYHQYWAYLQERARANPEVHPAGFYDLAFGLSPVLFDGSMDNDEIDGQPYIVRDLI